MAWLTGWGFRKQIDVQDANIDGNLTDFPILVVISADADFHESLATGYDIRFTSSDEVSLLYYERLYWTGGNGSAATAVFWVKTSLLSSGGATIYCYYGKAGASDGQDSANTWDANFQAVWHLDESGNGSDNEFTDSSGNTWHGTGGGASGSGDSGKTPAQDTGKIYKAQHFDHTDDFIHCGAFTGLDGVAALTVEGWINVDVIDFPAGEYQGIIASGTSKRLPWIWGYPDSNILRIHAETTTASGDIDRTSATHSIVQGTWYHFAAVWDGSDCYFYMDAVKQLTDSVTGNTLEDTDSVLLIGDLPGLDNFDGLLEDIRISDSDRGVNWIKFEHANVHEGDNELTWGNEAVAPVSGYIPKVIFIM